MKNQRPAANGKRWRSGRSGTTRASLVSASSQRGRRAAPLLALLLLAGEGMTLPSAEAADLIVDSGTTTISDLQSYDTTTVATSGSDTATLAVTTAGTLTNSGVLRSGVALGQQVRQFTETTSTTATAARILDMQTES